MFTIIYSMSLCNLVQMQIKKYFAQAVYILFYYIFYKMSTYSQ